VTSVSITAIVAKELQLTYVWPPDQLKQFAMIAKLTGILIQSKKTFFLYGLVPMNSQCTMFLMSFQVSRRRRASDTDGFTICPICSYQEWNTGHKGTCLLISSKSTGSLYTLPRLPSSATFVKMIRSFKGEEGKFCVKSFYVRQTAVLCALNWLKKYNQIYIESVTIDESNLD
jgi:hypothetical protein